MRLAHITPTAHLESVSSLGDYYLALSHIQDSGYWEFHKREVEKGRTVFLDNGVFETGEPVNFDVTLELLREVKAQAVYAPDLIGNKKATIEGVVKFGQKLKAYLDFANVGVIGVAQGETFSEWTECVMVLLGLPKEYCSHVALPYIPLGLPKNDWLGMMKARIKLCSWITESGLAQRTDKTLMLTGLVNPIEVYLLGDLEYADSSIASICGSKGVVFNEVVGVEKPHEPLDFNVTYNEVQLKNVMENVRIMHKLKDRADMEFID